MQTKSSTKKARKGSAPTKAEQRAQLARTLSAILKNPETPSSLYNGIADAVCDLSEGVDFHTPEMIEACLVAYELREQKRTKGGAR